MQFGIGLLLAALISLAAYAAGSLSKSGAIAAVALGTSVYGAGGWQGAVVLLAFFSSSSIIERLLAPVGRQPAGFYAKGGRRDAGQVLGNGLAAVFFLVVLHFFSAETWPWVGFAGSVAAVTADTWATEIGALSRGWPRLITHLSRRVPPGTSGGVSREGTLAAVLGAVLIAALAAHLSSTQDVRLILPVAAGGLLGAAVDSVLGATAQSMYMCTAEQVETEQHPVHRCGSPTVQTRGWRWLNNDIVNFLCAASGSGAACLLALAVGRL